MMKSTRQETGCFVNEPSLITDSWPLLHTLQRHPWASKREGIGSYYLGTTHPQADAWTAQVG